MLNHLFSHCLDLRGFISLSSCIYLFKQFGVTGTVHINIHFCKCPCLAILTNLCILNKLKQEQQYCTYSRAQIKHYKTMTTIHKTKQISGYLTPFSFNNDFRFILNGQYVSWCLISVGRLFHVGAGVSIISCFLLFYLLCFSNDVNG